MRESLSSILRARYPSLYTVMAGAKPWPFCLFGFEPNDGWFGLIDALSQVVASRVVERGLDVTIVQVKEKLGTLRYYARGLDDFCLGAKFYAEAMSSRLSERSGRPGLPSRIGFYLCTLAPGEDAGAEIQSSEGPIERWLANRSPRDAMVGLRTAWPFIHIDAPDGLADAIDALIRSLTPAFRKGGLPSAIVYDPRYREKGLIVDMAHVDERHRGMIAIASRLVSTWIDPETGAIGPVDDAGHLSWISRQKNV